MAKEVKKEIVKEVSQLNEAEIFKISFKGSEYEVSGNVANILINKGVATLIK